MDAASGDLHRGGGGVEAFVFDLAELSAVDGIGLFCAEGFCVKILRPPAYFLVRREGGADRAVRDLGMRGVVLEKVHDLGDAGFVVRAEKSGPVGDDQVLPYMGEQFRKIGSPHNDGGRGGLFTQDYILALIVLYNARADVPAAAGGRCVHMGDKADGGLIAGKLCVDVAVLRIVVGRDAHVAELFIEKTGEVVLLLCGWLGNGFLVRLGVDLYVAQKALDQCCVCDHCCPPYQSVILMIASGRGSVLY